jgi:hypothetical protein
MPWQNTIVGFFVVMSLLLLPSAAVEIARSLVRPSSG